jgi:hypothetical protein
MTNDSAASPSHLRRASARTNAHHFYRFNGAHHPADVLLVGFLAMRLKHSAFIVQHFLSSRYPPRLREIVLA